MASTSLFKADLNNYLRELNHSLERCLVTDQFEQPIPVDEAVARSLELLHRVRAQDGKAMIVGNGGSAAIASHMQNDLCKCDGMRAMVFSETPLLTAWTNDVGYEVAYERQLLLWAEPRDILIAISSSGQSQNIVRTATTAQQEGVPVITLSGFSPKNTLRQIGDLNFFVPSMSYGMVELSHSILCHFLTDSFASPTLECIPC
ncbi:MAG: SIS domain-containing protein [Chlamydiia bacterium]|nr:SIS domain-containing protein [Chlamydiia bacterium]